MKLTAAREELLAPLQSVIGVVERRQTMPVARERACWRTGQQTKRHGERSRGRAGRNLHGERAAAGRYHGARPRISPKALACELGGNRLPQVQVNAPARRRVPASLRLRTSLRDPAAVRGTKRDADTVRHAGLSGAGVERQLGDRKSTRLNSSHTVSSYAVFCLKKKPTAHRSNGSPAV